VHRIVFLDNRSLHMLGKTSPRIEVRSLLLNTVVFLFNGHLDASRSMLRQAYSVYRQHVQASNRLRYVVGVAAGVCVIMALASLPRLLGIEVHLAGAELFGNLLLVIAFAGEGAITSVLTRLSSLDLSQQTSKAMVVISGASRPVTAVCFAMVVFVIIHGGIIEFNIGSHKDPYLISLVAAFLCGFSERFAQDLLGRFATESSFATSKNDAQESPAVDSEATRARG
jgi:hypothetical protein